MGKIITLKKLREKAHILGRSKILISMPSHRGVPYRETQDSLDAAMQHMTSLGYHVLYNNTSGANIARNRNIGVENAKEAGADWLFFVDDDMVFDPDAIDRLVKHRLDVVSGLCVRKTWPYSPTIHHWVEDVKRYRTPDNIELGRLIECDGTGTAFLLINMRVFNKLEPPYFCFPARHGRVLGEDLYFCEIVKKAGYKIYVDTGVIIGHLGLYPFTIEDTIRAKLFEERQKAGNGSSDTERTAGTKDGEREAASGGGASVLPSTPTAAEVS